MAREPLGGAPARANGGVWRVFGEIRQCDAMSLLLHLARGVLSFFTMVVVHPY